MDSSNIDNHSKTLVFKKIKRLLDKYYPKFAETLKKHPNDSDIKQFFFFFLHGCVSNMKNYYSIDRLLRNINVLQVGTVKNSTTPLYSDSNKK